MPIIFIDTNLYLNFYNSNAGHLPRILDNLTDMKEYIFLPQQVVSEIRRNRLGKACDSFEGYKGHINIDNFRYPTHLRINNDSDPGINKKIENLEEGASNVREMIDEASYIVLEKISKGEDAVSKKLKELFEYSDEASNNQIERAKKRKMLGNPPGKNDDPVGDELSWIQLIDKIDSEESIDNLYIATRDSDFYSKYNNRLFLNSFLRNDVDQVGGNVNVYLFKRISERLSTFEEVEGIDIEDLPEGDEMEEVKKEEMRLSSRSTPLGEYYPHPKKCPECGSDDWVGDIFPLRSSRSYLTLHIQCSNCDYVVDTREPYE